jgi:glucose-1-phosphate thymidylyltransferase
MSSIEPQDVVCLVLCAGKGTRMQPLTYTRPKQLLPICNRPLIDWILEDVHAAGLRQVCLVTDPDAYALKSHIRQHAPDGLEFSWAEQKQPLGIAHAVRAAEEPVGGAPFVLYLGDALYDEGVSAFVQRFCEGYPRALIRVEKVDNPQHYGTVGFDANFRVTDAREKDPKTPWKHAITGLYAFPHSLFLALDKMKPGRGGEFQITDVIHDFLTDPKGKYAPEYDGVYAEVYGGSWIDAGRPNVFLQANAQVFDLVWRRRRRPGEKRFHTKSKRLIVGRGSELSNCTIEGDVVIGRGCSLTNATVIGPCAVNDGAVITDSLVENSIIDREAVVAGIHGGVSASIIGVGAHIRDERKPSRLERAVVGDGDHVSFYGSD